VAEYDLKVSDSQNGLEVKSIRRIEQIYQPEAAILTKDPKTKEEFIMTYNSGSKFKLYASETQLCRKTCIGPTFGGILHLIQYIPNSDSLISYATENVLFN
jgi:hypothetical protein